MLLPKWAQPAPGPPEEGLGISTSLNYTAWETLLPLNHPRREYILHGVKHGFSLITQPLDPNILTEVDNYKSATNSQARPYVEAQIRDEIANGRYRIVDHKPCIVSALGAIPKNVEKTKYRLILDASRPYGRALNDFAKHDPFRYQSLQDAIDLIKPGYFLSKLDLQNSFRSVGIARDNYSATGLKWHFSGEKHSRYMFDTRVCFGGRRSLEIFNELSQAVLAIMKSMGYTNIVCYCDDFLVISPSFVECQTIMWDLMRILCQLGFSINYNKVLGPSQQMTFLRIELNSTDITLRLPQDKLCDIRRCLVGISRAPKITKRQLQSLIGKLNWATQVIHAGRFHLRRLLDRISGLCYPSHDTRVTRDMRADIAWWLGFMDCFNGLTKMVNTRPLRLWPLMPAPKWPLPTTWDTCCTRPGKSAGLMLLPSISTTKRC